MMRTCYILDDEDHALDLLQDYIGRTPGLALAGRETRPLVAWADLDRQMPDILFADIDMPALSGLELARLVRGQTTVIFTTSFREYGAEAFELQAADYLLKPFPYDRFLQAIQRVRSDVPKNEARTPAYLFVKTGIKGQLQKIAVDGIHHVAALQAYCEIFHAGGKTISHCSLTELLSELPEARFSRIHRSFIVNHDCINRLEPGQLRLRDGQVLPLGRQFREVFYRKLGIKNQGEDRNR